MSEARWKTYISGKKYGPVDDETIRQWIAEHRVTATTQVWRPGMPKWLKAREVSEFSMYFDETVAAMPALQDEVAPKPAAAPAREEAPRPAAFASPSPAPVQMAPLADPAGAMYGDDDAPTVVQASPFLDVENKQQDSTIRVQPSAPEPAAPIATYETTAPSTRPAPATKPATAQRPGSITKSKPGLPLIPFFLALIALLPAASFGYLMSQGVIEPAGLPFYLMCGAVLGLVLIMIPPLFFSMAGMVLGLLGGLLALGGWVTLIITSAPGDLVAFFQTVFIASFAGGPVGIAMGVLNWCTVVVGLLAILYFAFSGKYRARARA